MTTSIWKLLYPNKCVVCHRVLDHKQNINLCKECSTHIVPIGEPRCKRCSKPLYDEEAEFCYDCEKGIFCVERGVALYPYGKEMQQAIRNFKYQGELVVGDFFAKQLVHIYGAWIHKICPDVLIPVPIHPRRQRFRGFNQAQYMAEQVGKSLGISVDAEFLVRTEDTRPQKNLGVTERISNLRRGFAVKSSEKFYRRVLLVDDIYTTGATLEACGMILKEAGAEAIYFLCVCIGVQ